MELILFVILLLINVTLPIDMGQELIEGNLTLDELLIMEPDVQDNTLDNDKVYRKISKRLVEVRSRLTHEQIIVPGYHPRKFNNRSHPVAQRRADYITQLKLKSRDLMQQAVYTTQSRLLDLENVLEKYKNDTKFRMAFLFGTLQQLRVDMRKIYTISWRHWDSASIPQHQIYYSYQFKMSMDVTYIIEHLLYLHNRSNVTTLAEMGVNKTTNNDTLT